MMRDKHLGLVLAKKWHFYVTRKFNWFVQNTQILANKASTQKKYIGFDTSQENYLILNGDEYYTDEESEKFNSVYVESTKKNPDFFKKLAKKEFKIVENINKFIDKLKKTNYKTLSNKQLASEINEFQEIYTLSFIPAFSRPDDYLEQRMKELIKSNLYVSDSKTDEIFAKIGTYTPLGKVAYTDEPLELLKIAKSIKDGSYKPDKLPTEIARKLDKHIEEHSWMKGSIFLEDVHFSKQEYTERLKNMLTKDVDSEIKRIENVRKNDQINYKNLIKEYKFNKELKSISEAVRNFIFLRTYTTEVSDKLFFIIRHTLLKEAALRLNLSSEDVITLTNDEIAKSLLGSSISYKKLINDRKNGYAIVWLNRKCYQVFGGDANKLQKIVADKFKGKVKKKDTKVRFVKGTPASLGKAKGIVKVLLSHNEVAKVNRGDVLVTSMTTPDFIIAMEKASAFITDEGGITCHAAIVAREFGVPCIVGTGNATALLKDGDFVQVNADKGIITKLN